MAYMGDIATYWNSGTNGVNTSAVKSKDSMSMDMTDFLTLMVAQFQNQSIDNTADTSDMLNQLVQMQMVQAITNMTDATVMTYASSLVGKEVTVGSYDADGKLKEVVGQVTGTGSYGGQQVVFVDDQMYYMSQIMAVGHLPPVDDTEGANPDGGATDEVPDVTDPDPETPENPEVEA